MIWQKKPEQPEPVAPKQQQAQIPAQPSQKKPPQTKAPASGKKGVLATNENKGAQTALGIAQGIGKAVAESVAPRTMGIINQAKGLFGRFFGKKGQQPAKTKGKEPVKAESAQQPNQQQPQPQEQPKPQNVDNKGFEYTFDPNRNRNWDDAVKKLSDSIYEEERKRREEHQKKMEALDREAAFSYMNLPNNYDILNQGYENDWKKKMSDAEKSKISKKDDSERDRAMKAMGLQKENEQDKKAEQAKAAQAPAPAPEPKKKKQTFASKKENPAPAPAPAPAPEPKKEAPAPAPEPKKEAPAAPATQREAPAPAKAPAVEPAPKQQPAKPANEEMPEGLRIEDMAKPFSFDKANEAISYNRDPKNLYNDHKEEFDRLAAEQGIEGEEYAKQYQQLLSRQTRANIKRDPNYVSDKNKMKGREELVSFYKNATPEQIKAAFDDPERFYEDHKDYYDQMALKEYVEYGDKARTGPEIAKSSISKKYDALQRKEESEPQQEEPNPQPQQEAPKEKKPAKKTKKEPEPYRPAPPKKPIEETPFKKGDVINHPERGKGEIVKFLDPYTVQIKFDDGKTENVQLDFVNRHAWRDGEQPKIRLYQPPKPKPEVSYKPGETVYNATYGKGEIVSEGKIGDKKVYKVRFEDGQEMNMNPKGLGSSIEEIVRRDFHHSVGDRYDSPVHGKGTVTAVEDNGDIKVKFQDGVSGTVHLSKKIEDRIKKLQEKKPQPAEQPKQEPAEEPKPAEQPAKEEPAPEPAKQEPAPEPAKEEPKQEPAPQPAEEKPEPWDWKMADTEDNPPKGASPKELADYYKNRYNNLKKLRKSLIAYVDANPQDAAKEYAQWAWGEDQPPYQITPIDAKRALDSYIENAFKRWEYYSNK